MMTPGSRYAPQRALAPGTTRTPAASYPRFNGILSAYSNGPELDGLHPAQPEEQEDRQPEPLVDDDLAVDDLGHPHLAPIEQVDGLVDRGPGGLVVTVEVVPLLPQRLHPGSEISHGGRLQGRP